MATQRQKKLAKLIVENATAEVPLNKKELLVSSGYSEVSADSSAKDIINQKGVQDELEVLGFDELSAKKVVSEILNNTTVDPAPRLKAADMIFKVIGSYAPEKSINVNINQIKNPKIKAIADKYNREVYEALKEEPKNKEWPTQPNRDKEI